MACRYILHGHTFNSEIELNQFLLSSEKFYSKYGDIVFKRSSIQLEKGETIKTINKTAKKVTIDHIIYTEDGEPIQMTKIPYIGVRRFIDLGEKSDGSRLVSEFIEDNYWNNRIGIWTDDGTGRNVKELYDGSDPTKGVYTQDEINFLFGGDINKATYISKPEAEKWRQAITDKWSYQGIAGTALHKIMEVFFTKDDQEVYNYQKYKTAEEFTNFLLSEKSGSEYDLLDNSIISKMAELAFKIKIDIVNKIGFGEDLDFYPELKITSRISNIPDKPQLRNVSQLFGIIDLLVVDKKGNSYIFDYKTSPKTYNKYNSNKKLDFDYQLAFYRNMLKTYGFTVSDNNQNEFIIPIVMDNFRPSNLEDIQNACQDNSYAKNQAKFIFDGVSYDEIQNITGDIKASNSITPSVNEYLPSFENVSELNAGDSLVDVNKIIQTIAPTMITRKHRTEAEIKKELDDKDAFTPKDGLYTYTIGKQIIQIPANKKNAQNEFFRKVKETYSSIEEDTKNKTDICVTALKYGIENDTQDISQQLFGINKNKAKDIIDNNWFENVLGRYCNKKYSIINSSIANSLGIIMIKNNYNNQIDIIKITGQDPFRQHYLNNKTNRSNLTYAYEDDIVEDSNKQSLMLKATTGNIELMEVLAFLNSNREQLKNCMIGKIQVMNPRLGVGLPPPRNIELQYTWHQLIKLAKSKGDLLDINDHISNGELSLATDAQIAINDFNDAMDSTDGRYSFNYFTKKELQETKNALNTAEDNTTKKILLKKIIDELGKTEKDEVRATTRLSDDQNDLKVRIFNEAQLALAELSGINYRQQLKDHDTWVEQKSFGKYFTEGLEGNRTDNPGQLQSKTLNTMTDLVTRAYQNIRNDMSVDIADIRKHVQELKKAKGYGYLQSRTIGNESTIFKNMTYTDNNGDLLFKNPDVDQSLSIPEKEFLNWALNKINKNRFPGENLEAKKARNDVSYFRVPLAKGGFGSDLVAKGLLKSLKDRFYSLNPATALRQLKEKTEGIFNPDDSTQTNQNLFEMNNIFDNGENDQARMNALAIKGTDYFERNLETLLLEHDYSYTTKYQIDNIMPLIRASMTYLTVQASESNIFFKNDLQYAKDYIKAAIKNQQIEDNPLLQEANAISGKIKKAASFCALAFSPVQGLYQSLQGLWQDISLIIRKPDGSDAFTTKHFIQAFKYVYKDLTHFSDQPTKVQLVNEKFGINDMDMNDYAKQIKSDKTGLLNIGNIAYKMASRPDYYNRMAIIVAKMIADGSWDAYTVVDGKLEYDWKKDKRYSALAKGDVNSPDYKQQQALYIANMQQFQIEGRKNNDGTPLEFKNDGTYPELPDAYTTQEMESLKSLCDLIYGYYSHEKKSLIQYTFVGSLFMQMKTYWSGKKNQYLQPGGVRVRGNWKQLEENGEKYFYQVNEQGLARTDLPPVPESQLKDTDYRIPFIRWEGLWQEGIIMTLADVWKHSYLEEGEGNIFKGLIKLPSEMYKKMSDKEQNEALRKVYRANLGQLIYDIIALGVIGGILAGMLLAPWEKELEKEAKEDATVSSALTATAAKLFTMSVANSAMDCNFVTSIGSPAFQWTPFSFESMGRLAKDTYSTIFGDRTFYGGVINAFSATKQAKPFFEALAPMTDTDDDE